MKAARANAALEGRTAVVKDDIHAVAEMVFLHRMKTLPFEQMSGLNLDELHQVIDEFDARGQA